ncbi:hypothetical protein F1737_08990 [Methanoplanus sp. FWC-SCC4]|uniref:Uncharacterized protein n=1 Tax=Methanochimaera problematica TaxID=2609417 RepID=A0AA97I2Z3_9EURY|nr:hypothetical protein [Methanoplanus sp. FWC-SCC4]WOF16815.1 hypothetical protein F1737_08990 [Methanoplanus sp. FWC-SCC4]
MSRMLFNYLVYIYDKLGDFLEKIAEKMCEYMIKGIFLPLIFIITMPEKIKERVAKAREENELIFANDVR